MADEIAVAMIGLVGALVGGGLTSGTTWLIAHGDRTKFAREKVWEDKRQTYSKIIPVMVKVTRIASTINDGYQDDPHTFDASSYRVELGRQYAEAYGEMVDAFESGIIAISSAFFHRFDLLRDQLKRDADNPNLSPPEQAEITHRLLDHHGDILRAMAAVEMDPEKSRS